MVKLQWFVNDKGACAGHLAEDDIACAVGYDAEDGGLIAVKLHSAWIDSTGGIPAIGVAVPAKIEVVVVVGIVSVADKGVAACSVATVHHHTAVAEVGAEHIAPLIIGIICLFCITGIRAYAEEIDHTGTGIDIVAATFCGAIAHIGCHAAVAHQLGNGLHLLWGAGGGEGGGHMGVVVGGAVIVDGEGAVVKVIVAVDAATVDGVAPVVDDLGHSGGYAAGEGVTVGAVGVLGAEGVVVLALVPGGGEEGTDGIG